MNYFRYVNAYVEKYVLRKKRSRLVSGTNLALIECTSNDGRLHPAPKLSAECMRCISIDLLLLGRKKKRLAVLNFKEFIKRVRACGGYMCRRQRHIIKLLIITVLGKLPKVQKTMPLFFSCIWSC